MLITVSHRTVICQSVEEVQVTGMVTLGAVNHRFNSIETLRGTWRYGHYCRGKPEGAGGLLTNQYGVTSQHNDSCFRFCDGISAKKCRTIQLSHVEGSNGPLYQPTIQPEPLSVLRVQNDRVITEPRQLKQRVDIKNKSVSYSSQG